ncbi:MAG TPA: hypothetical protein VLK84_08835 [Longimicrobium sp.]|nr:hypothetical protein [Longimicrobium sp.]
MITWIPDLAANLAKPAATALTTVGAAIAIWATYKAAEEWDDPAKPGKERLTSWGKVAIILLSIAGGLAIWADAKGDPTVQRLIAEQDSLRRASDLILSEVRLIRAELHRSPPSDTGHATRKKQRSGFQEPVLSAPPQQ